MTKKEVEKLINFGGMMAYAAAAGRALELALSFSRPEHLPIVPAIAVIIGIVALGFGVTKKSRICGVTLCVALVASITMRMLPPRSAGIPFATIGVTFFVVSATVRIFQWHRLDHRNEKTA